MRTYREWNASLVELTRRWGALQDMSFPAGIAGVNIDGVELVLIDADVAMLIRSCIKHGKLSKGGAKELGRLIEELRGVLPRMSASARSYITRLIEVGELALQLREI